MSITFHPFPRPATYLLLGGLASGVLGCGAEPALDSRPELIGQVAEPVLSFGNMDTAGGDHYYCAWLAVEGSYRMENRQGSTICGASYVPDASTTELAVYAGGRSQGGSILVISFRGTQDIGDVGIDLLSGIASTNHQNLLCTAGAGNTCSDAVEGSVGAGWEKRWADELASNNFRLRDILRDFRNSTMGTRSFPLEIHVTGHSLGAAVALLAAFDIQDFFKGLADVNVNVIPFNPPRLGSAFTSQRYREALDRGSKPGAVPFNIAQFTREGDTVQNIPPGFMQPVWNTLGSRFMELGSRSPIPYCPQYHIVEKRGGAETGNINPATMGQGSGFFGRAHNWKDWNDDLKRRPAGGPPLTGDGSCMYLEVLTNLPGPPGGGPAPPPPPPPACPRGQQVPETGMCCGGDCTYDGHGGCEICVNNLEGGPVSCSSCG